MRGIFIINRFFYGTLFFIILSCKVYSQFGSSGTLDARSIGMAKTYIATSQGIQSIGTNPANLSLMGDNSVEFYTVFPLPLLSFHSGTDFMTLENFNYYFGGVDGSARYLTEDDKRKFNDLFNNGGLIFANFSTTLLSISIQPSIEFGTIALTMNDYAGGSFTIPKAFIDLGLNGNQPGRNYDFSDEKFKSWWIRNYSLSYSRELLNDPEESLSKVLAGFSIKLLHGYYYAGIEEIRSDIQTSSMHEIAGNADMTGYSSFSSAFGVKYDFDSVDQKSNLSLFMPPAGNGFGFDIGASLLFDNTWSLSFAVTDIGKINWAQNTAKFSLTGDFFIDDLTDQEQLDSLEDKISRSSEKIGSFSTGLPTALRIGTGCFLNEENNFLPGNLSLGLDFNQGLNDLPGNSKKPRISFGMEWKPGDWIPYFRSGISIGGAEGFGWAFGLGMYSPIIDFNFATSNFQGIIVPSTVKQISIAFDSKWKF